MKQYLEIIKTILDSDESLRKPTRTGIDTISYSGLTFRHDMRNGFPLLTTKKMAVKSIFAELEFFIKGLSDKKWLQDRGCHIWDEWANPQLVEQSMENWRFHNSDDANHPTKDEEEKIRLQIQLDESNLGRIYGVQWRDWRESKLDTIDGSFDIWDFTTIDQLKTVVDKLKSNPLDRRMIVSAWRPDEINEMALPPCHYAWQLLSDGKYLDLIWIQRSVDSALGLPFNIASYAMLLLLLAKESGLIPRNIIGQLGDVHVYENHIETLREQLKRTPYKLPTIEIPDDNWDGIFNWEYTDYELSEYTHHSKLKFEIAI